MLSAKALPTTAGAPAHLPFSAEGPLDQIEAYVALLRLSLDYARMCKLPVDAIDLVEVCASQLEAVVPQLRCALFPEAPHV
jgi:hypothetical protein